MTDYIALRDIQAPGTAVFGYRRGDRVIEDVVRNWDLAVGDAVALGTELPDEGAVATGARPGPEGTRADWEAYAVANGMDAQEAAEVSQETLEAVPERGVAPARPADSATKAEWIDYVIALGADPAWARDSATTKANLQAYAPEAP